MAKQIPQGERDVGRIVATVRQLVDADPIVPANPTDLSQRVTDLEIRLAHTEDALAELSNTFLNVGNGWVDPYDDDSGIDAGTSSNHVRTGGYIAPTQSGGSVFSALSFFSQNWTTPNIVGDGTTSVAASSCATKTVGSNVFTWIGYRFSPAAPIDKIVAYGSNNQGFVQGANPAVTIGVRAHTASPSASNFTTLGTALAGNATFTDTSDESAGRTFANTGDRSTSFDRFWIVIQHAAGASAALRIAELQAYSIPTVGAMTVTSIPLVSPTTIAEMSCTAFLELFDPLTINTDITAELSGNSGTNWTTATLIDESTAPLPGGSTASVWRRLSCPFTAVTAGTVPRIRWKNANSKYFRLHQTRLMWK